ncbi:MAG: rhomboid family intramembrane serine protease [Bacteroidales bacterium]|jgi:membrane associated rhomboid family serine protease|nr:rhomboid family intramembrane serine protease [Bacteroidales bacterium]
MNDKTLNIGNILNQLKKYLKVQNNLQILIYINVVIFIIIGLINLSQYLSNSSTFKIIDYLAIPANPLLLLKKPWTIITYMFTHENFLHLLFNLLILFTFGKIFLTYLTNRQLLGVYIMGGISGAIFFILAYNIIPVFTTIKSNSIAIGASASIIAVVMAISFLMKNLKVNLFIFGQIKLIYVAIFIIILDLLSIPQGNAGGHIAHLGGATFGFLFSSLYTKNIDITKGLLTFFDGVKSIFKPEPKIKVNKKTSSTNNKKSNPKNENSKKMDEIIEKVKLSGYSSLTEEEKKLFFQK